MSVLNKIVNIKYDSTKPVGPLSRTANISKAKSHLGWDPKIGLEEGIARTAKWIKTRIKND